MSKKLNQIIEWYDSPDAVKDSRYNKGVPPMADEEGDQHRDLENDENRWQYMEHQDHLAKTRKESNDDVAHITKYVHNSVQLNDNLIRMHHAGMPASEGAFHKFNDEGRASKLSSVGADNAETQHEHFKAIDRLTKSQPSKGVNYKLYTGIGGGIDIGKMREQHGDKVHFPAFTSASAEPDVASKFAKKLNTMDVDSATNLKLGKVSSNMKKHREMLEIHVDPNKTPNIGYHLGHHNGIESEYLLRRGMVLKFHGEPVHVEHQGSIYKIHKATIEGFKE